MLELIGWALAFAPHLQKYKAVLELRGTIALQSNRSANKNWWLKQSAGLHRQQLSKILFPAWSFCFALAAPAGFAVAQWRIFRFFSPQARHALMPRSLKRNFTPPAIGGFAGSSPST